MRVSYEALAWGRHVNTYERSWEIVRRADHPALGLCVDSFHILSRGSDPAGIRDIPGEKLFFLQLADAPHLDMNVLQWSRHHRLFPGQGAFDLPAFLGHVLVAGYTGPLSLEVFNDVFRQADPRRAAVDALRSLLALDEAVQDDLADDPAGATADGRVRVQAGPCAARTPQLHGFAFAELAVDDECGAAGRPHPRRARLHPRRTAPQQAGAAVAQGRGPGAAQRPAVGARRRPSPRVGVEVDDPTGRRAAGDGAARPAAAPHPRPGRGRPVRRRRAGRDGGVLLPHRVPRRRLARRLPRRRPGRRADAGRARSPTSTTWR